MKTINIYIGLLFLLILSACTDDTDFLKNGHAEFVTLNLDFKSQGGKEILVGRAATAAEEQKLYDLHFYVFNAQGRLTGYEKLQNRVTQAVEPEGTVSIRTKSGNSYIYAIANINESTTYYLEQENLDLLNIPVGTNDREYWENIENSQLTRELLLNIQFKRKYGNENNLFSPDPSGNVFVMSGYINNGGMVNIPESNGGGVALPKEDKNIVKLYRILSKITLTINPGTNIDGTFTPKYYRLCNVPKGGILIPKDGISTVSNYLAGNTTSADVESSYRWNFDGNQEISFYYPENLQVPKANSQISDWQDREKNSWANNVKTFTYAADNASYIEIYGDYTNSTGSTTANVNYTIHFGDFGANVADFNLMRNYAYNYRITFKGINDIIVEATASNGANSDRPYAEGMVVVTQPNQSLDIDAHYEARVLTFKKADIQALRGGNSGYLISVKTPFGETSETVHVKNDGVYRMGETTPWCSINDVNAIFTGEADYQWIKFVRNTNNNKIANNSNIATNVCKYPGDGHKDCLNVFQLLAQLYDLNTYTDKNGTEAYYTCFIDENYYANKNWPEYVNKDPRTMLIANDLQASSDGKSLYAEVAYSISQRSITTFYTTDYYPNNGDNLVKAFGTEIIDEEKIYSNVRFNNNSIGTISNPQDWDARSSAISTNQNQNWYNNMKTVEGAQPLYTTVAKACMSRNRDLDGDGTIDGDEVRWYLAGVDQYRALFFGQNSLDSDAYLIKNSELTDINTAFNGNWGDDSNGHSYRSKYHYFTCSGGDKTTFWPEEGLTNNPTASQSSQGWVSEAQLVRCIRTLVSKQSGLENPERFYSYANNTFDLGGIKATRNYTEKPLEKHNEIEAANNLYNSFVMAKNDLKNGNKNTFALSDITGGDSDFCSNYNTQTTDNEEKKYSWRTPNQKEIALMVSLLGSNSYGTRTRFSGSDKDRNNRYWNWHNTPGFWTNSQRINVGTGHENGVRIRCVRDKQVEE